MLPIGGGAVGPLLGSGTAELLLGNGAAELLPSGLGDLEGLPLQEPELEVGAGQLEATELLPTLDDSAVLLDPSDPFLPQSEDVALPATASLFTADGDFPPLHIDASDFQ